MSREEFLKGFQDQFDETDASIIGFDTNYKELAEWSSMMALIIIAFIDECFSKTITGDDFRNSNTIEDLYQIITTK
jgi:acyl carrier protein